MATAQPSKLNGNVNGDVNGAYKSSRFSDIPRAIDVPLTGAEGDEAAVEVALGGTIDEPAELCQLLENETAAKNLWVTIALAYAKTSQFDNAITLLQHGLTTDHIKKSSKDKLALLLAMAWLQLLKSRQAPRALPEAALPGTVKTKETFLQEATATVNEALRINPAFPPLHLLRGVLFLLRASLVFSKSTGKDYERIDNLKQALKCFEDALQMSGNRNMMALIGRARVLFMQARYGQALSSYQEILSRMPGLTDPDPRIGIGCCLSRLGYPDKALAAWKRALELNPNSKEANALLAVAFLREANKFPTGSDSFGKLYKQAISVHAKVAYDQDRSFAFACTVFGTYFLHTGRYAQLEQLARAAIEKSDVNSIISDGWFLLARKEHTQGDLQKANDYYARADAARGGPDRDKGYLPAKFGLAQLQVQRGQELGSAKLTLEKLSNPKNADITTLLGCIYAEEQFSGWMPEPVEKGKKAPPPPSKKSIELLESVRKLWKDEKSKFSEDETVLLYLARLYENDNPMESLKCLLQVEQMQILKVPADEKPEWDDNDVISSAAALREHLSPQLLNNMACLYYCFESYETAREMFQIALNACVKLSEKQEAEKQEALDGNLDADNVDTSDTDALVTTISYNLARTYESLDMLTEASKVYEGLLSRHSDYTDAIARLAFMSLEASPREEGPKKMQLLYSTEYGHLEVRALMGWYHHSSKRRANDLAQDAEYRHFKHTLQNHDKHDVYSLTGAGNVHLSIARDMPRNTDQEREKRSRMYGKAIEFLDKAIQLDPRNAYGAQGIAIALCDDKKNYSEALQVLTKVKDAIRDPSVFTNLGHVMTELRQYQRGIDNYEIALKKDARTDNTPLLACLSRTWLLKGKADKSIPAHHTALQYMERALATQPDSPHLKFNVAFIQFQIATLINSTKESDRELKDVEAAISGLEAAITTFDEVAQHKTPPYPKAALEQRSTMGRNTIRRQLQTAKEKQERYEQENASKLHEARTRRDQDTQRREAEKVRKLEEEQRERERIQEARDRMIAETEKMALDLRAEAMAREAAEWTEDSSGERVKRSQKKRKAGGGGKKGRKRDRDGEDGFIEDDDDGLSERSVSRTPMSGEESGAEQRAQGEGEEGEKPKKKRRKLERRGGREKKAKAPPKTTKKSSKFKSAEKVVDSSDEEDAVATPATAVDEEEEPVVDTPGSEEDAEMRDSAPPAGGDGDDDDEEVVTQPIRKRKQLRTIADDEDDEDGEGDGTADADLARRALAAVDGDED